MSVQEEGMAIRETVCEVSKNLYQYQKADSLFSKYLVMFEGLFFKSLIATVCMKSPFINNTTYCG